MASVVSWFALFMCLSAFAAPQAAAQVEQNDTELGPIFLLSLGGKLYDDLFLTVDQNPPAEPNPAIPATAPIDDRDGFRCVTCHGWSYDGAELGGIRFPGLRALAGADPDAIRARIADPKHPFPVADIPDLALDLLAFFIREGLYEPGTYLDSTGVALGNPEFGRAIFEGACINCHQLDGRRYLRGEPGDRSSLGWVSRTRPEQALHKVLNGVPAAEMLSLRFLSDEEIADLFAYLQTLDPEEQ